jgi:formate-dependent nitrite reductase membrane component NrfD
LYIFFKPNFNSWLVIGSYIIVIFGVVALFWLYLGFSGKIKALGLLIIPAVVFGTMTACYSAFLFHQARGRDLWQSNLLFVQLLIAAVVAGSAAMTIACAALGESHRIYFDVLCISATLNFFLIFLDMVTHHTLQTSKALPSLLSLSFHLLVAFVGFVLPLAMWVIAQSAVTSLFPPIVAALGALVGLGEYERLWIKAGQVVPLS